MTLTMRLAVLLGAAALLALGRAQRRPVPRLLILRDPGDPPPDRANVTERDDTPRPAGDPPGGY